MINNYCKYLDMPRSITIEEMDRIHQFMEKALIDDCAEELYDDLVKASIKYAEHRMKWLNYTREEKMEQDAYRTSSHDSLLVRMSAFSRYIEKCTGDVTWMDVLKHQDNTFDRKKVGDFACYIAFMQALHAR